MDTPIIFNQTDFEENIYDFFTFMMYKGEPFTGTLVDGLATIEFKNGNAHGRSYEYWENGQLACDEIFDDGNFVSGKHWYKNGQIKHDSIRKEYWDIDGQLAKINHSWLYKNGVKRNDIAANGDRLIFSSHGDIAIQTSQVDNKKIIYFYDQILRSCYNDLLTNPYPLLIRPYSFDFVMPVFEWISKLYCTDRQRGEALIKELMEHDEEVTRDFALQLNKLAIKIENGSGERTYWLEDSPNYIIVY